MPAKNGLVFLREEDNLTETVVVPGGLAMVGKTEDGLAYGSRNGILVEFDGQEQVFAYKIAVDIDKFEVYIHLVFREAIGAPILFGRESARDIRGMCTLFRRGKTAKETELICISL